MEISSKYNPSQTEAKIYERWLKAGSFRATANRDKPYSVVIPPPNVTGILHIGHALNNTIQDVLVRFKRMQQFDALWMPGVDHAGIATQNVVERNLAQEGSKKETIGREEFTKRLWDWTDKHGTTIIGQLKKLGASCDWERTRFTMDSAYSRAVGAVFIHLYDKGLIYRGNYMINWCPHCLTALSDEESARRDIDGWLYYIKYPVFSSGRSTENQDHVVVATTRPETMLGDTAVAINPGDKRYAHLAGASVVLPLVNRKLRVIEDEAVEMEFGTGVVKVTPAHDPVDFSLGKKHNLDFINIMNDDATLNHNVPDEFIGIDRFEARRTLIDILEEKKLIVKKEPHKIAAGHCYRCHTVIEPRISMQWFVRMKPLAAPAIDAVEKKEIRFHPPRWEKVYLNWMHNIQDWCISRQIWWGHRIPAYYCLSCFNPQADTDVAAQKGLIVSQIRPQKCPHCGSSEIEQEKDVLDTWFSSWLWPFATFYWPLEEETECSTWSIREKTGSPDVKNPVSLDLALCRKELDYFYPTNTLVTASEILFFWVARMIMAGLEFMGKVPFGDVLIHGTVRDAGGVKMSKSLGNTIDPLEIINEFGADALRFSLMLLASSGSDVYLSREKFLVGRNFCNKIWNATRFILIQMEKNKITVRNLEFDGVDAVDEWVLAALNEAITQTTSYFESYRINEATKEVYDFFWHSFCDWYFEVAKNDFTPTRAKVIAYVLIAVLKLIHPVMPYISEEIFGIFRNLIFNDHDMLIHQKWPQPYPLGAETTARKIICDLFDAIAAVRNLKVDLGISTKKVRLEVAAEQTLQGIWREAEGWFCRLAAVDALEVKDKLARVLYKTGQWQLNLAVDDINAESFRASLDKKITQAVLVRDKAAGRLNNISFRQKAPEETIEKEKKKVNDFSLQIERLTELKNAFR